MTTEIVDDELIETPGLEPAEEVQRLRKSQRSILAKSHERRARIEELETENATLKTKVDAAEAKAHEVLVGTPLRALAEEVSEVPKLWLSEFQKRYKVDAKDGKLVVLNLDGTPAMRGDEPIPVTANGIWTLLTGGGANYAKDEDTKTFAAIMRWQGANGSGATGAGRGVHHDPRVSARKAETNKVVPTENFGLK